MIYSVDMSPNSGISSTSAVTDIIADTLKRSPCEPMIRDHNGDECNNRDDRNFCITLGNADSIGKVRRRIVGRI